MTNKVILRYHNYEKLGCNLKVCDMKSQLQEIKLQYIKIYFFI